MVDIFHQINEVNLLLQGKQSTIIDASEKLSSFCKKIDLWLVHINSGTFSMFSTFDFYSTSECVTVDCNTKELIKDHLLSMKEHFRHYFPSTFNHTMKNFIKDPFNSSAFDIPNANIAVQEQFIDLISDSSNKIIFECSSIFNFWCKMFSQYPLISKLVLKIILPFSTTYECESGFSSLLTIKSKNRNRLNVEHDLRCALSKTTPQFDKLVSQKQHHPSH